jgi:DNA-binding GntR family transcriptional regulator
MDENISLREKIYRRIKDDITYGKILPGERLVESRVAEEFKASRAPIREALRQLESEGLTKFERNKGITVLKLSIREIDEIYSLRWLLESYAARLSAEKATRKQVTYLRHLQDKLKGAVRNYDLSSWIQNNILFHNFFSENSGNSNLIQMLDTLKRRVYRYHYTIIRIPGHFKSYIEHHEGILRACEKNDGDMAEKFMKLHLETIKDVLIRYLKDFPGF